MISQLLDWSGRPFRRIAFETLGGLESPSMLGAWRKAWVGMNAHFTLNQRTKQTMKIKDRHKQLARMRHSGTTTIHKHRMMTTMKTLFQTKNSARTCSWRSFSICFFSSTNLSPSRLKSSINCSSWVTFSVVLFSGSLKNWRARFWRSAKDDFGSGFRWGDCNWLIPYLREMLD